MDVSAMTAQNRRAWNEVAKVREAQQQPVSYFAEGGCQLDARTVEMAGVVNGLSLCHLQCATGEDTLSWANCGALVTGVDIADQQIDLARIKAASAGIPAEFIAADVYDLPPRLTGTFDIVFTGGGAIVWLPELTRWAQIIAALLKPGGRLIIDEEHPLAACLEADAAGIRVIDDYFGRRAEEVPAGWGHVPAARDMTELKYEAMWPMSDVIMALIQAGLSIEAFEEYPSGAQWRFGEHLDAVARLPGAFVLIARKPAAS